MTANNSIEVNKDKIISLLQSTKTINSEKEGTDNWKIKEYRNNHKMIERIINFLDKSDFFVAPASTSFHGNYEGGLAEHSLNVYDVAIKIKETMVAMNSELEDKLPNESIIIVSLLHDICKANVYKKEKRNRKVNGKWEEYEAWGVDYSEYPLGHGEKSVIRLLSNQFLLTKDEMLAIRWHMAAWELPFQSAEAKSNLNEAKEQCPLLAVLQAADGLASSLLEVTK